MNWEENQYFALYEIQMKTWLKNGFFIFLKLFLTHFDIQAWENDTVRLLWRSQKKILRPSIKNRLDTFVPNVPRINLIPFSWSYDQNWLRETLKTEKKTKTPARSTFWNNMLQVLTKIFSWQESPDLPLHNPNFEFFVSLMVTKIFCFENQIHQTALFK